jgi:PhnB protein
MSLSFHIDFNGQCQEAFEFYAEHLQGRIGTMLLVKDAPMAQSAAEDWQDKVVHANISIHGVELAGADVKPEQYQKPTGFCVLLGFDTVAAVKSAFSHLSVGGEIILAPQKTFWSSCYAIVTDRFGVPWKINCAI